MAPTHLLTPDEFDHINSINYRGVWLSAREELLRMMKQEPLPTHDGRPGNRGSIVNVASNLALVSRNETRKSCTGLFARSRPLRTWSEERGARLPVFDRPADACALQLLTALPRRPS